MFQRKSKQIRIIVDLMEKGNYKQAIDQANLILKNKDSSKLDKLYATFLKGNSIDYLGVFEFRLNQNEMVFPYYEKAFQEGSQLEENVLILNICRFIGFLTDDPEVGLEYTQKAEEIHKILEKDETANRTEIKAIMNEIKAHKLNWEVMLDRISSENRWEKIINLREENLKLYQKLGNKSELILTNWLTCKGYEGIGNYQEAIKKIEKTLEIAEEVENKYWQSRLMRSLALVSWASGDVEKIPFFINQAIPLDEELGNEIKKLSNYNFLGVYYRFKGDCDKALDYFQKVLEGSEKNNHWNGKILGLTQIGSVHEYKGEIGTAIDYLLKAQKLWEEENKKSQASYVNSYIAKLYYLKGELITAYDYIVKELEIHEKFESKFNIALSVRLIGKILWQQGKANESLDALKRALQIFKEIGNILEQGNTLTILIKLYVETNQYDLAKEYLEQFSTIISEIDNKPLQLNFDFVEALVLKISDNQRDRIKSEGLFEQLLKRDLTYSLRIDVMLNLSELLLIELQTANDESLLVKVKKHIADLYQFAEQNNSFTLKAETLYLQSQIALIELEFKEAQKTLQEAQKIVDAKDLKRLETKIQISKEVFDETILYLAEAGKEAIGISKRMELVNIENSFKEIKKSRLVDNEIEDVSASKPLFSLKI